MLEPDAELVGFLARYLDPQLACPWSPRSWPGFGMAGLTWATGFRVPPEIRVNRFRWPRGASRWASLFCLASADQVNALAPGAFGTSGLSQTAVDLLLSKPGGPGSAGEAIEARMFLLAPAPLSAVLPSGGIPETDGDAYDSNNLYLLTLVDERYYWQYVSVGAVDIDDSGMTWPGLVGQATGPITAAFPSTTFTQDPVDPAYLYAGSGFNLPYRDAPSLLDAAAFNVGQRVVRSYAGAVNLQNFANGLAASRADSDAHPDRRILAGGSKFPDASYW